MPTFPVILSRMMTGGNTAVRHRRVVPWPLAGPRARPIPCSPRRGRNESYPAARRAARGGRVPQNAPSQPFQGTRARKRILDAPAVEAGLARGQHNEADRVVRVRASQSARSRNAAGTPRRRRRRARGVEEQREQGRLGCRSGLQDKGCARKSRLPRSDPGIRRRAGPSRGGPHDVLGDDQDDRCARPAASRRRTRRPGPPPALTRGASRACLLPETGALISSRSCANRGSVP